MSRMLMDCVVVTPEFVAASVNGHERMIMETIYVIKKKRTGLGLSSPKCCDRLVELGWVEVYDNAKRHLPQQKPTAWIAFLTDKGREVTRTCRAIWRRKGR